jgi:hypothetical protein
MTRLVLGTVVVFICCVPRPVHAQSGADWQLELGGVYSIQPGVSPETLRSYRFDQGVEGSAFGLSASVARSLSSRVEAGIEVSVPSRFESTELSGGLILTKYDNEHRDIIVSGLIKAHPRTGRVAPEAVGGLSLVYEDTRQTAINTYIGLTQPLIEGPFSRSIHRVTFGACAGGDVTMIIREHFGIVPAVRLYWIGRDTASHMTGTGVFLDSFVVRTQLSARLTF